MLCLQRYQTHAQRESVAHPDPSNVEMCRGREGRAGQRSAAGQRSRGAPRQWLMFVWRFGGSLILTQRSARRRAQSRSTLEGKGARLKIEPENLQSHQVFQNLKLSSQQGDSVCL